MTRDDEAYIHFQECLTSLNRTWVILGKLEGSGVDPVLRTASYHMALIEYAKPFKESRGANKRRHFLAFPSLSADDTALHSQLLALRDQVLAHSDLTVKDAKLYVGESNGRALPLIISNTAQQLPRTSQVRQLVEHLLDALYAEIPTYEQQFKNSP